MSTMLIIYEIESAYAGYSNTEYNIMNDVKQSLKQWATEVTVGTARRWHWIALVLALVIGREC